MHNRVMLRHFESKARMALTLLVVSTLASPAHAQVKLGSITKSIYNTVWPLQIFLSTIVFILGMWYILQGIQSLRATGEGGNQAPPMSKSLFKLGGGAALVSLPFIAAAIINSFTGSSAVVTNLVDGGSGTRNFNSPGLDHALGRFVQDFFEPFMGYALPFFCYMAGLILIIRGLQRLATADGKGATAPGGLGTFGIFITAAALMSIGYFMAALQGSIFGVTDLYANVLLVNNTSPLGERAQNVLWAVFQFLRIIGYISVVRGLFQMKTYADGGQASLLGATTHIIAGAMLANVWYFIWAVQNTFVQDTGYFVFQAPS